MRILLTGSTGFIGRHLLTYLSKRHELVAPSSKDLNILDTDAVQQFFKANPYDAVIHAAMAWREDICSSMIHAHLNLLSCSSYYGRMIYMGSGAEYGKQHPIVCAREVDFGSTIPSDPYGLAKYVCNQISHEYGNVINLRLFGVYGPGEQSHRFISSAIQDARLRNIIRIRQDVRFSYLWIGDLVRVVEIMLGNDIPAKTYNIVPSERPTLTEISNIINSVRGTEVTVLIQKLGMNNEYTGNADLFGRHFADFEFQALKRGIENMVKWLSDP
jgi:UDP-glucose 4-epimerase